MMTPLGIKSRVLLNISAIYHIHLLINGYLSIVAEDALDVLIIDLSALLLEDDQHHSVEGDFHREHAWKDLVRGCIP